MDIRGFHWLIALAVVSAACSGPTRGGMPDAVPTSTSLSTIPGTAHDTAPPSGDVAAPGLSPATVGAAPGGRSTATTTARKQGASSDARLGTSTTSVNPATTPPGLPPERCPDAKACRRYNYSDGRTPRRWRAGPDGRVTIPYRINPSGATTLTPEQIEGAMAAAFRTWESAAPALRFVYEGRTTMQATSGDGVNVIVFNSPTIEHTIPVGDRDGHVVEFDMLYAPGGWTWAPCRQADGSCTPHNSGTSTTGGVTSTPQDLQSIATHAVGHALWLGDQDDFDLDRELTMYPSPSRHPLGSRFWSTLALGDVLGVRSLYPCSCPLPPIYSP